MPTLYLKGASVPADAKVPATLTRWVSLFEQIFTVEGGEGLTGILIQTDTPDAADRDKPWLKLTAGGAPEGIYVYTGTWTLLPVRIPSVDVLPASPQNLQIVYHEDAIKIFRDGLWSTNLKHSGATEDRPESPPDGYLFTDTTINRDLRYVSDKSKWTTVDGCLGEAKMLLGVSLEEAITRNPGWAAYAAADGKFLRIAGGDTGVGDTGGRESFDWKLSREYFEWGSGAGTDGNLGLDNISIDGNKGEADPADGNKADSADVWQDTHTVNTIPPFLGVTLIRKEIH